MVLFAGLHRQKRGWFGLRLDRPPINWAEIENVLERSYCLFAPKKLVSIVIAGNAT
jgi:hypothetical protein